TITTLPSSTKNKCVLIWGIFSATTCGMGLRLTPAGTVAPTAVSVFFGAEGMLRSLISYLMTWRCSRVRLILGWTGAAGAWAGAAGVWARTGAAKPSKVTQDAANNAS